MIVHWYTATYNGENDGTESKNRTNDGRIIRYVGGAVIRSTSKAP